MRKNKSILFGSDRKLKSEDKLNIHRGSIEIQQHPIVTYLGCLLDCNMSGERHQSITENQCEAQIPQ